MQGELRTAGGDAALRIGLVTPSWPGGATPNGIATAVAHLAAGLEAAGHAVTAISVYPAEEPGPAVIDVPEGRPWSLVERLGAKLGYDLASAPITGACIAAAVLRAVRERGVQVVLMEETHGWAGYVARQVPIPVVVVLHGPWFLNRPYQAPGAPEPMQRGREAREGAALRACAGILAPSRDVLERVRARYRLPDVPQAVIPNPITLAEPVDYARLDATARRSILFVGRFELQKGGDTLLAAFAELVGQGADARLTFVGPDTGMALPGGGRLGIAAALAALPAPARARIDYRGPLAKAEIARLRRRHGVAAVASRYETLGYTLLESLAAGVATVATAAGGPAEVIRDDETGLWSRRRIRRRSPPPGAGCSPTRTFAPASAPPPAATSRRASPRAPSPPSSRRSSSGCGAPTGENMTSVKPASPIIGDPAEAMDVIPSHEVVAAYRTACAATSAGCSKARTPCGCADARIPATSSSCQAMSPATRPSTMSSTRTAEPIVDLCRAPLGVRPRRPGSGGPWRLSTSAAGAASPGPQRRRARHQPVRPRGRRTERAHGVRREHRGRCRPMPRALRYRHGAAGARARARCASFLRGCMRACARRHAADRRSEQRLLPRASAAPAAEPAAAPHGPLAAGEPGPGRADSGAGVPGGGLRAAAGGPARMVPLGDGGAVPAGVAGAQIPPIIASAAARSSRAT